MSKLLDTIGVPEWLFDLVLAAILVAGLSACVYGYGRHQREAGRQEVQAKWDADRVIQQQAALKAQADNASETQRRLSAQQEIMNETTAQLNRARADADAARNAGDRLRAQLAAYVASADRGTSSNSTARPPGPPASTPVDLLADMFRSSDEAAGIMAAALDAARAAGLACERQYDALTP